MTIYRSIVSRIVLVFLFSAGTALLAQKDELFVLTYKFKDGEQSRIRTSSYTTLSTVSPMYNNSMYGETDFDVLVTVTATDESGNCAMNFQPELTKKTVNGQNLTYRMAGLFNGDKIDIGVDRFGKVLENSVEYLPGDTAKPGFSDNSATMRSVFVPFPDFPVKIKDQWRPEEFGDTLALALSWASDFHIQEPQIKTTYTFESVDHGIAKIALTLEMSGKGKIIIDNGSLSLDYAVLATGSYFFDIKAGALLNGSVTTQVVGIGSFRSTSIDVSGTLTSSFDVERIR